ncbi:MAG: MFS transporter [Verrucomicrobia bacterium]|jgi:MFS family permease|nr:MFS transporter [Verrucomicrobiota bacterium]
MGLQSVFQRLGAGDLGLFRFGIYFSFANAFVWMIALGAPMVLMAEMLGASSFQVGLLYSAVFLFLPVQVLSTVLLPLLGFRRQVLISWGLRSCLLLVPLFIAFLPDAPDRPWALGLYIASIFLFCFFRSVGTSAHLPWLYSIIPERLQGKYFGSDSLVVGVAGIITLVTSSALFVFFSANTAFQILFTLTVGAGFLSLLFLAKLPDGDRPKVVPLRKLCKRAPQLFFRQSHFRKYMRLQMIYAVAGYAFVPFSVYYLRTALGFSQSYILFLTALQFFGMTLAALVLKEWVDRVGPKPFFVFSHAVTISIQTYWLVMLLFPGYLEFGLPGVYVLVGIGMATFLTSNNKYLPQICHQSERALSVSVLSASVGLMGGLAVTLWGFLLKDEVTGSIDKARFIAYFVVAISVQSFLFFAYRYLKRFRGGPDELPFGSAGGALRPFRYITRLVNLVEPPKR